MKLFSLFLNTTVVEINNRKRLCDSCTAFKSGFMETIEKPRNIIIKLTDNVEVLLFENYRTSPVRSTTLYTLRTLSFSQKGIFRVSLPHVLEYSMIRQASIILVNF